MKERVQKFGRFLSGMVMPNIGAFIAWGLVTALFIETGWLPNANLAELVGPTLTYLLPILIGYTGGKMVGGERGAVVGAIATIGVIIGADVPMFLGAMVAGPLGGFVIKSFDKAVEGKIPAGFEMLVNNFSAGILGAILAIIAYLGIGPLTLAINNGFGVGVNWLVNKGLLPLSAIIVEPAKVLFLNNAINHGVFTPLGIEQAAATGKSIFFMIESNPGPGLGLLMAYWVAGKGDAKSSAPGAIIIHFLGGIHEIYFPYILMNPILILATMAGNAVGILTLQILNGGLVAAASPGSIFAQLIMTPRGGYFANIMGILLSTVVSFVLAVVLLRAFGKDDDIEESKAKVKGMKAESKGKLVEKVKDFNMADVRKIAFVCDAGMGSSAMGATKLRNKINDAGLDIDVVHSAIGEIPQDTDLIITHKELYNRAKSSRPEVEIISITNFINAPEFDTIVDELVKAQK